MGDIICHPHASNGEVARKHHVGKGIFRPRNDRNETGDNLQNDVENSPSENEIVDLEEEPSSLRSKVYEHFRWIDTEKKRLFKRDSSNSTGNLRRHMKRKHMSIYIGSPGVRKSNQRLISNFLKPKIKRLLSLNHPNS
ncbi:unnamed protein product [Allacma fusca]|uniref:Uncharacterized protein n=1 Tax=Allacma fusca TaxID=39272 RepID=A0A8J2PFQ8_9HEXA|nr:unnamed protein product [Allacma fusca]